MTNSYDYVQIVKDEDWGLVGIVPHGGTGEKVKKMSIPPRTPEAIIVNTTSRKNPEPQITRSEDNELLGNILSRAVIHNNFLRGFGK